MHYSTTAGKSPVYKESLLYYGHFISVRYPVPMWAIGAIVVVVLALVACMGFCIYKKCFNKGKKPKKVRERKGGRGRLKKNKDGEEGDDKKVRLSL